MKKIILNEVNFVMSIIENKRLPEGMTVNMAIVYLCRFYYYNNTNITLKEMTDTIITLLSEFNLTVAEYEEYKAKAVIKSTYNKIIAGKSSPLRDINEVPLYKSEYENIKACKGKKHKKVLFTLYILGRLIDKYGWVYNPRNEIYKLANVSIAHTKKENIFYDLIQAGYLRITNRVDDTKIGVNLSEGNEEVILTVNNIDNLGNQLTVFEDPKYKICTVCGNLVRAGSNRTQYCKHCAKEMELINTRKRVHIYRENQKSNGLDGEKTPLK